VLCNLLTMNSADIRTEIGTTMPRITELLSHDNRNVRWTSVNALSKFIKHSKTGLFCYAIF